MSVVDHSATRNFNQKLNKHLKLSGCYA